MPAVYNFGKTRPFEDRIPVQSFLFSFRVRRALKAALLITLIVFSANLIALWIASKGTINRLVPAYHLDSPSAFPPNRVTISDRDFLRVELEDIVSGKRGEEKVLAILAWVMNEVKVIENTPFKSSKEIVLSARSGRGVLCGGMARLFRDALISNGIPARIIYLNRTIFGDNESHTTVEAYVNGKWRLYDPTFHIALIANGERVGIFDARRRLFSAGVTQAQIEFLGDVNYPARVETYSVSYASLLNNAYVVNYREYANDEIIPDKILRGRVYAYPADDYPASSEGLKSVSEILIALLLIVPLSLGTAGGVLFYVLLWRCASGELE